MAVRRGPFNLHHVNALRTAQALRELADMAERGGVIGVAVGYVTPDRAHRAMFAGVCERDRALAYLLAGKMSVALLNQS